MVSKPGQRQPSIEPDTPTWFKRFAQKLADFFVLTYPTAPVRLAGFDSADLPAPASYAGCLIFVTDTGLPAFSDGASWFPLTPGAPY